MENHDQEPSMKLEDAVSAVDGQEGTFRVKHGVEAAAAVRLLVKEADNTGETYTLTHNENEVTISSGDNPSEKWEELMGGQ